MSLDLSQINTKCQPKIFIRKVENENDGDMQKWEKLQKAEYALMTGGIVHNPSEGADG